MTEKQFIKEYKLNPKNVVITGDAIKSVAQYNKLQKKAKSSLFGDGVCFFQSGGNWSHPEQVKGSLYTMTEEMEEEVSNHLIKVEL